MDNKLKEYREELNSLIFNDFNSETALWIGQYIIDIAQKNNYVLTIDIRKCNHQLFHFSFDGTSPDKDVWVKRKSNIVQHFSESSIYMAAKLRKDGTNLWDKYGLSPENYAAVGGSVPILLKNCGVIGAITVSGLTPEEDHALVIQSMKAYLNNSK